MKIPSSRYRRTVLRHGAALFIVILAAAALSSCSSSYTQIKSTPEEGYRPGYEAEPYYDYEAEPYPTGFPALDPYGRWVYVNRVGWAWQPNVYDTWRPYYYGQWVWSAYGWTWLSYEPFGWAVYHYGNWVFDPYWGWIWLPGYDWYPNRVTWVVYDHYIGWAPMPIDGYQVGDPWMADYGYAWHVCEADHFTQQYVGDYEVRNFRPKVQKNESRVIEKAPEVSYVQAQTGRPVTKVALETQPVTGGREGLVKLKVPPRDQENMTQMRKRTEKALYGDGSDPRYKSRPKSRAGGGAPNVGPPPKARTDDGASKDKPSGKEKKSGGEPSKKKDSGSSKEKKKGKDDDGKSQKRPSPRAKGSKGGK